MFNNNQAPTKNTPPRATEAPITRNGSAILIVVGTLALIAVFAAIYISIGQSGQRVARSIKNQVEIEANANTIADHVLDILAKDRLGYTTQRNGTGVFAVRDATDAPYTDWTMRSESNNEWEWFNPAGRHSSLGTQPGLAEDFRVSSDPWLAATSPTYLGNPGQPISNDLRPFASLITEGAIQPSNFIAREYSSGFLDKRDWLQISNLAPDGRFVNLFNLRAGTAQSNGFGDNTFGGFDSESGIGTFTRASDGRSVRRMSEYLSLWDQEEHGDPESRIITYSPQDNGGKVWLPGRNDPADIGLTADEIANTPAAWTMYQRFMFLPLNQPFMTVNRNNRISTWADPDYAPYQYADADGDGMADSRWIELTSAQDANHGGVGASQPREDIERLYDAGNTRIFAAIRVMDLSSLVNVNTAMEQLTEPDPVDGGTLGYTPADVDLRRLLSLTDAGYNYSILQLAGLSPSSFHKPTLTSNNDLLDPDYKWYRNYIDPASTIFKVIEPSSNALSIGRYAYSAIKLGIEEGGTLDANYTAWPPELRALNSDPGTTMASNYEFDDTFNPPNAEYDPNSDYRLKQYHRDPSTPASTDPMTERQRSEWYMNIGRLDPLTTDQVESSQSYPATGSLYNKDDLLELLAFHGLNDPATVSRLEKAAMGRMPSIFGQNQRAFSPLLSNRPLTLDRERHGFIDESSYTIAATDQPRKINGSIAKESMVFFAVSPRRLLTTVSGGAAILPGSVVNPTLPTLTVNETAPVLSDAFSSPTTLFGIYSNALAGELDFTKILPSSIDDVFVENPDDARDEETATLFYGHRGPELALRIAAHMAVNSADLYDSDTEPTAATLILDDSTRDDLIDMYDPDSPDLSEYLKYAGRSQDNMLDPGAGKTPDGHFNSAQKSRQAVNVFGIEPMPFIAEVASMYVYTDSATGDVDYLDDGRVPRPPRPGFSGAILPAGSGGEPALVPVTIEGTVSKNNKDFMMQVLAFQLTNPWTEDIILGGTNGVDEPMGYVDDDPSATNTTLKFDYYIEYGGRFFKLGEFVEFNPPLSPIFDPAQYPDAPFDGVNGEYLTSADPEYQYRSTVIPAGESRVFYAIAHSRFDGEGVASEALDEKWLSEVGSFTDDGQDWTGPAEEWINRQFSIQGGASPIHIHQFDPENGSLREENEFHDLIDLTTPTIDPPDFVYSNADRTHDTSKVRLWRKIVGNLEEDLVSNPDPTPPAGTIDGNYIQNDMLVDRFDLGSSTFLQRPIVSSGTTDEPWQIEGSVGYDPVLYDSGDVTTIGARNDNFGLSVVRWVSMRRGDNYDPDGDDGATDIGPADHFDGQVASWMLSSRRNPNFNTRISEDQFEENGGILTIEDFLADDLDDLRNPTNNAPVRPEYEVHETFADLLNLSSNRSVIQTIAREPQNKWELNKSEFNPSSDDIVMRDKFPQFSIPANIQGKELHPEDIAGLVDPLIPEILPSANQFNEAPRLADLLLAWGIGPTYTPDIALVANIDSVEFTPDDEKRWITLPEAIAIALGYETITPANYNQNEPDADIVWMDAVTSEESIFDNGHLAIDKYVAYFNTDTSEDPPEFNFDAVNGYDDIRRGTGAPMALGVLDQARAIASLDSSADQLITPTFGQININTAPVEVLRLLPGLSPVLGSYYPNIALPTSEPEWWGQHESWELPDLSTAAKTPDVAAAIVGYRDRLYVEPRFRSADIGGQQDYNPLSYASADPDDNNPLDNTEAHARNLFDEEPTDILTDTDGDHRDRQTISGIDGIRQTPGFGSLGEILAVSFGPDAKGAGNTPSSPVALRTAQPQLSIQQYFHDNLNLDGDDVAKVAIDPQLFGGEFNGSTKDDYAERLAMANGILNMISVRSDYYAVWFVVHAYQESDVTNLQPEDPLIPSLAKRYVMVVDRSNVTDPGDTPKIVFLREVPM